MRVFNRLVFEQVVHSGTSFFTSRRFDNIFGSKDVLAINVVADNANIRGALSVAIEHSGDGINWKQKNATPEINSVTVGTSTNTDVIYGADASFAPNLQFVRLRIDATTLQSVHVQIHVTVRDSSKPPTRLSVLISRVLRRLSPDVAKAVASLIYALKRVSPRTVAELGSLIDESWTLGPNRAKRLAHIDEHMSAQAAKELVPVIYLAEHLMPQVLPHLGALFHLPEDGAPPDGEGSRYPHIDRLLRGVKPEIATKVLGGGFGVLVNYFSTEGGHVDSPPAASEDPLENCGCTSDAPVLQPDGLQQSCGCDDSVDGDSQKQRYGEVG